jgi:hypothetical protein
LTSILTNPVEADLKKRDTHQYATEVTRFLKHWYPDDDMERDAQRELHSIIEKVDDGTLKLSELRGYIKSHYPAHHQVGFTVDWQILNLLDSCMVECDIECGLKNLPLEAEV